MTETVKTSHNKIVTILVAITLMMFVFGFALVPLYDVFCTWTGLNGKVDTVAAQPQSFNVSQERWVTVEFVTSLNETTPMLFKAEKSQLKLHPGEYHTVNFIAENKTNKRLVARAIPSITPGVTSQYLKKIECFCFNEQVFEPGQRLEMPVRFTIDPELPAKYNTLTLAYTFFDITDSTTQ
jgi:cytochrome c oxidase assembly protein subunit 11